MSSKRKPRQQKQLYKLSVRHLPADLEKEQFLEAIGEFDATKIEAVKYVQGSFSLKDIQHSRCYISFTSKEAMCEFQDKYQGHVFSGEGGTHVAVIEVSLFNKLKLSSVPDGNIEDDPIFQRFVKCLEQGTEWSLAPKAAKKAKKSKAKEKLPKEAAKEKLPKEKTVKEKAAKKKTGKEKTAKDKPNALPNDTVSSAGAEQLTQEKNVKPEKGKPKPKVKKDKAKKDAKTDKQNKKVLNREEDKQETGLDGEEGEKKPKSKPGKPKIKPKQKKAKKDPRDAGDGGQFLVEPIINTPI